MTASTKHISVQPSGATFVAHIIDQDGAYLSEPAYGGDPWAAAHTLIRQVCKRCWTRDRRPGEKFCQPCGLAFLKSIAGCLQSTYGCRHHRDPWCRAPYWQEGEDPAWQNVERAYEEGPLC